MRSVPSIDFTRVVIDGHDPSDVAELHSVIERIRAAVHYIVPQRQELYVGGALLNLAVSHLLAESGTQHTASTLIRLVDSVLEADARGVAP